jgi:hypothetical protein
LDLLLENDDAVLVSQLRLILSERNIDHGNLTDDDIAAAIAKFKQNNGEYHQYPSQFLVELETVVEQASTTLKNSQSGQGTSTNVATHKHMVMNLLVSKFEFYFAYRTRFVSNVLETLSSGEDEVEVVVDIPKEVKEYAIVTSKTLQAKFDNTDSLNDAVVALVLSRYPQYEKTPEAIKSCISVWTNPDTVNSKHIKTDGSTTKHDHGFPSNQDNSQKQNTENGEANPSSVSDPKGSSDNGSIAFIKAMFSGAWKEAFGKASDQNTKQKPADPQGAQTIDRSATNNTKQKIGEKTRNEGKNPAIQLHISQVMKDVMTLIDDKETSFTRDSIQVVTISSYAKNVYLDLSKKNSSLYGTTSGVWYDVLVMIIQVLFEIMNKSDGSPSEMTSFTKNGRSQRIYYVRNRFYEDLNIPMLPLSCNTWNKVIRKYIREKGLDTVAPNRSSSNPYRIDKTLAKTFNLSEDQVIPKWSQDNGMISLMNKEFLRADYHAWDVPSSYHEQYGLKAGANSKYPKFLLEELLDKVDAYHHSKITEDGNHGEMYKQITKMNKGEDALYQGRYKLLLDLVKANHITYMIDQEEKKVKDEHRQQLAERKLKAKETSSVRSNSQNGGGSNKKKNFR